MDGLSSALVDTLRPRLTRSTAIADGRFVLDLPLNVPPATLVQELTSAGGRLVSLNPLRDTLEDLFVKEVAGHTRAVEETR